MCVCTRGCVQGFDSGLCVKERERQREGVKPGPQKAGGWMEAFEASKAFTQLLFKQRGKWGGGQLHNSWTGLHGVQEKPSFPLMAETGGTGSLA